jgi:hypothetical protein
MRGLPAMKAIVANENLQITIPVSNFIDSDLWRSWPGWQGLGHPAEAIQLELDLTKFVEVIGPFAKSIKCLESTHSTAADVYLFWLAIMSQLEELFREDKIKLPNNVKEEIRAITNRRFNGMINDAPTDVYVAAFFLDPRTPPPMFVVLFFSTAQSGRLSWIAHVPGRQSQSIGHRTCHD